MSIYLLNENETYTFGKINGDPLITRSSDGASARTSIAHSLRISSSTANASDGTGRLLVFGRDGSTSPVVDIECGSANGGSAYPGINIAHYNDYYTQPALRIDNQLTVINYQNSTNYSIRARYAASSYIRYDVASGSSAGGCNVGLHSYGDTAGYFLWCPNNSRFSGTQAGMGLSPTDVLHVNSTVTENSSTISDARLKDNVHNITGSLDRLLRVRPVEFTWKHLSPTSSNYNDVGVIAQELQEIMPGLVNDNQGGIGAKSAYMRDNFGTGEFKSVNYEKLVPYLIDAVKELKQEIDILKFKLGE